MPRRHAEAHRTTVGADGLNSDSQHVSLVGQQRGRFLGESWRMRSIILEVYVVRRVLARPVRSQQHPGFSGNTAVFRFPLQDILRCYEVISVTRSECLRCLTHKRGQRIGEAGFDQRCYLEDLFR